MRLKEKGRRLWGEVHSVAPLRFGRYQKGFHKSPIDHYARYLWNLDLCREIYVAINVLEVVLRSRIHQEMTNEYGPNWYDDPTIMAPRQINAVNRLRTQRVVQPGMPPDKVIAHLMFGYWHSLFDSQYTTIVHNKISARVFKHRTGRLRRAQISGDLNDIRQLRNRVAHQECVCDNIPALERDYRKIRRLIQSMSYHHSELERHSCNLGKAIAKGEKKWQRSSRLRVRFMRL